MRGLAALFGCSAASWRIAAFRRAFGVALRGVPRFGAFRLERGLLALGAEVLDLFCRHFALSSRVLNLGCDF